jgi:tetraacyldisaccharide 4'-kinase
LVIVTRWLWRERTLSARALRVALLPLAVLYRGVTTARTAAYRHGIVRRRRPALPSVAIGNLTVGGSGKTPLAQWIARQLALRGLCPAIVLRGYGGDEGQEHREAVPSAIVIEDPDRHAAIRRARGAGANVAVLDDAFQRLDVLPELTMAVVSAEASGAVGWPLPAGPWREPWQALGRADLVVATRKRAGRAGTAAVAARVRAIAPGLPVARAVLSLTEFRGLVSDIPVPLTVAAGRRLRAVAGIADADSFAAQLRRLGAEVDLWGRADHARYGEPQRDALLQAAASHDYVVITAKDAVKLKNWWPADLREPLVARLGLAWEDGADVVHAALDQVAGLAADP